MRNLLFLVHRLPYPPNKGDKVRSYHLLRHLCAGHRVFLGTFIDDPEDEVHLAHLRSICPDVFVARIDPQVAKVRSLLGLAKDCALSLCYYRNAQLQAWVTQTLQDHTMDAVVVFSSVMAQYVQGNPGADSPPLLVDFVDVDSAKWTQYAASHRWPLSWLYRREGAQLLTYERSVAARAQRSFFVTQNEAELFQSMAPESAGRVLSMSNGVDVDHFSPHTAWPNPFRARRGLSGQMALVFTGAMDYWPNMDAVIWFVGEVLPQLLKRWPQLCFYIVGRSPPACVVALASESVVVTGTVLDVRPYLQHASLVVAPLRVARGLQNKILEAMAMGRPVVASSTCAQAIEANAGELVRASGVGGFVAAIDRLLSAPARAAAIGQAARQRVQKSYSWGAHLSGIDRYLTGAQPTGVHL
jgi:sugar transferase (PEP-CTERM/EpsH1 system associated)